MYVRKWNKTEEENSLSAPSQTSVILIETSGISWTITSWVIAFKPPKSECATKVELKTPEDEKTTLGFKAHTKGFVNLEPAIRLSDRLGGHLVSGHVDGLGRVVSIQKLLNSWSLCIKWENSIFFKYWVMGISQYLLPQIWGFFYAMNFCR